MFWSSRAHSNNSRSEFHSLRVPLELQVEVRLRDELHRCMQEGNWPALKDVLVELQQKKSTLGAASIAAIVNSRIADNGPTPLHLVCGRGDSYELARSLLSLGADPNAQATIVSMRHGVPSDDRPTALFCAIGLGDQAMCKLLLKYGANPDARNSLGETPLLFLARVLPLWGGGRRAFTRALLKVGANPVHADLEGGTPLAEHLLHERWADAAMLAKAAPEKLQVTDRSKEKVINKFIQVGISALARSGQDTTGVRAMLVNLRDLKGALGTGVVSAVLNHSINGGPSFFARMIDLEVSKRDILLAESIGASFTATFDSRIAFADVKGASALHHAIATNDPQLITWALSKVGIWHLQQPLGEDRMSALHLLYLRAAPISLEAARILINAGVDPKATTSSGVNLFDMAVMNGDIAGMDLWAELITNPYAQASPEVREMALHDEEIQNYKKTFSEFGRLRVGLNAVVEREMKLWAGDENAPDFTRKCREYLEAYAVALNPSRWISNNPEMYRLLPRAMLSKGPMALLQIVKAIDTLNDDIEHVRGWHPFQAELMALLAHPTQATSRTSDQEWHRGALIDEGRELRRAITLALTSIHRFNNIHIFTVPASTLNLWARIGVGCFSFRYQKWDAQGISLGENRGLSLLEQYGFTPLHNERGSSPHLGVGYELSRERKELMQRRLEARGVKFDAAVRIQYYQGCKRAFLPGVGDFILRNSSPFFGPHLLRHPAYFSRFTAEHGLDKADATALTPVTIEQSFMPILQSTLYVPSGSAVAEIEHLLSHIEEVDRDIDAWKFDTRRETAWETIEGVGTVLAGGYYSDGFPAVVQHLYRVAAVARSKGEPMPHLAFFSRSLPAWRPIPYTDMDGKQYSTLELTPETLELLKKLKSSSADRKDFRRDNGRAFQFFQMGLDSGAALVIIDGKETSNDM